MKRAQITTKIFVYLLAAIIAILLLIFGYRALTSFGEAGREAVLGDLTSGLGDAMEVAAVNTGSISDQDFTVPDGVTQVCFVDTTRRRELLTSDLAIRYPLIRDALESDLDRNTFLIKSEHVDLSLRNPPVCLDRPYYLCVATPNNRLRLSLEGKGACVDIKAPLPEIVIENKKNDQKYGVPLDFGGPTKAPAFFIERDRINQEILTLVTLSIWNDQVGGITKYPLLVYHTEGDVELTPDLVEQMLIRKEVDQAVFFPDLPAGITPTDNMKAESFEAYFDYWEKYKDVVVTADDNEEGQLMATLFASYIVAPLLFLNEDNYDQFASTIQGRRVFIVDSEHMPTSVVERIKAEADVVNEFSSTQIRQDATVSSYKKLFSNILTPSTVG